MSSLLSVEGLENGLVFGESEDEHDDDEDDGEYAWSDDEDEDAAIVGPAE